MLAALGILAALASFGAALWAPEDDLTYDMFTAATEVPMSVLLPVIAVLDVTSECSQRTALATSALVPQRGRVLAAKYVVVLMTAVASIGIALVLGAVGNVAGAQVHGVSAAWDVGAEQIGLILISQTIGMSMGFMFGVALRSSSAAIVGYFAHSLVLPVVFGGLVAFQEWFEELQPWVDLNLTSTRLTDVGPSAEQWAQLGTASVLWLASLLWSGFARPCARRSSSTVDGHAGRRREHALAPGRSAHPDPQTGYCGYARGVER